jgi:GGDEF domain-containing protein
VTRSNQTLPDAVLVTWLASVHSDGELPDRRLVEAATDLVDTMATRPEGLRGAMYRFGNTLGNDGWPVDQLTMWIDELARLISRRDRRQLQSYTAMAAMAQGWADGYVRGANTGMCLDPTTGLATAMVLQLRLREIYDQCRALGVRPAMAYTLLIVDTDVADMPRLEADVLMASIAAQVTDVFRQGETVARAGNRIMVLASNTEITEDRAAMVADRLRTNPATRWADVLLSFDEPPQRLADVDRYVRDLAG